MSKLRRAPSSDDDCCCAAKKARPSTGQQKNLYVVLDDRDKAFSVHKLDVDEHTFTGLEAEPPTACLPEPPFLRVEVPRDRDRCHFAALSGRIIALHTDRPLIHDTKTAALAIGSPLPPALSTHGFLAIAAAGRLYALPSVSASTAGDMYYLEEERPFPAYLSPKLYPECSSDEIDEMRRSWREGQDRWVWNAAGPPMPFNPGHATCHAVHPDRRTLFVSVKRQRNTWMEHGTFSLDADRGAWTRHGDWLLPFQGEAFYDEGLDAWVGLDEDGHLCTSNGLSRCEIRRTPPAWKRGKETVLREADPERRLGAALAYMGDGRFCLVERAVRAGVKTRHASLGGDGDKCELYVSTFCVRYGKYGELTTTARRAARSYAVSRHREHFPIRAFYM